MFVVRSAKERFAVISEISTNFKAFKPTGKNLDGSKFPANEGIINCTRSAHFFAINDRPISACKNDGLLDRRRIGDGGSRSYATHQAQLNQQQQAKRPPIRVYYKKRVDDRWQDRLANRLTTENLTDPKSKPMILLVAAVGMATVGVLYLGRRGKNQQLGQLSSSPAAGSIDGPEGTVHARTPRSLDRFRQFSSVELAGVCYMTPSDFLDSVIHNHPRPRQRRKVLSHAELEEYLRQTPRIRQMNLTDGTKSDLFKNLGKCGVIAYSEYLFLLSLMTRSATDFKIAFDVVDRCCSGTIAKSEYVKFCRVASRKRSGPSLDLESSTDRVNTAADEYFETTLMVHLFDTADNTNSRRSKDVDMQQQPFITFDEFCKFVRDFQFEVLEAEFKEYSGGNNRILVKDFLQYLLKFTDLTPDQMSGCEKRLEAKGLLSEEIKAGGVSFDDFLAFVSLLNRIEDFAVAVKFHSLAGKPLTMEVFKRAAAAITPDNQKFPDFLVKLVFAVFDISGDDALSYEEFLHVMRNRHQRRLRSPLAYDFSLASFTNCLKDNYYLRHNQQFHGDNY